MCIRDRRHTRLGVHRICGGIPATALQSRDRTRAREPTALQSRDRTRARERKGGRGRRGKGREGKERWGAGGGGRGERSCHARAICAG